MAISTDGSIAALNSNGATFTDGTVLQVAVLRNPDGWCRWMHDSDYTNHPGGVAGQLVVTHRGTCSRVGRAIRAQAWCGRGSYDQY